MDDSELRLHLASDDPDDVVAAVKALWPAIGVGVRRMTNALLSGLTDSQQRRDVQRQVALEIFASRRALARSENIAEDALIIAFLEIDHQRRVHIERAASSERFAAP